MGVGGAALLSRVPTFAPAPAVASVPRRCVALGCRMLSLGIDMWVVQRGLRAFQTDYANVTL